MTAAERLVFLAGAGGTAAALLLTIGSGTTSGAALVNYSELGTNTAAVHLLAESSSVGSGGEWYIMSKRRARR